MPVPPAREHGWWRLIAAALAFTVVARFPVLRALAPVQQPLLLIVPALAACAVVGWWRGGSLGVAIATSLVAVAQLTLPLYGGVNSAVLAAGWSAILAGCFGLALLVSRSRRLLAVGGMAITGAFLVATVLVVLQPAGPSSLDRVVSRAFSTRGAEDRAAWQVARSQIEGRPGVALDSASRAALDASEASIAALPRTARTLLPATLALQSLAALALAWGFWHRLSRTRVGEALGALRDFRFNDQLVWAIIAGLALSLLPGAEQFRALGLNLLLVFGTLYALRGAGVLAWFVTPGRTWLGLVVGIVLLLLLRDGAAVALAIVGIGDTWVDWRRRAARTT
jgi:hypothetical protein